MVPSSATSRPAIRLSRVDFPHPEGPISATKSPEATVKLAPLSARTGTFSASNVLRTFSTTKASISSSFVPGPTDALRQFVCQNGGLASFHQLRRESDRLALGSPRLERALGDHRLTRLRKLLEPLGHVHRVTYQRVLEALFRAQQCGRRLSGRQTQPEPECRQTL